MDLAVGVIIGAAFQAIVNSLVNDIVMPVISLLTGGTDFSHWVLVLGEGENAATLNYGMFINSVIDFLLMAFVIFCFIKFMNHLAESNPLKKKDEEEEENKTYLPKIVVPNRTKPNLYTDESY